MAGIQQAFPQGIKRHTYLINRFIKWDSPWVMLAFVAVWSVSFMFLGKRNKGSQHLLGSNIEIPRKKKYHVIGADKMIEYPYSSAFKDFGQRHAHTDPSLGQDK